MEENEAVRGFCDLCVALETSGLNLTHNAREDSVFACTYNVPGLLEWYFKVEIIGDYEWSCGWYRDDKPTIVHSLEHVLNDPFFSLATNEAKNTITFNMNNLRRRFDNGKIL